jgi:zeta-carotene desaturase
MLGRFTSSPITGIHLWFERQISELDHAVLLDRTIQWMFHKSRLIETRERGSGSYVELVVSCSRSLVEKSKAEIVEMALRELQEFFPAAQGANLLKSTVIKEVNATYSPGPGVDNYRPKPDTPWPRVFLSGDWTATGWPATMEGAVRSGYLTAEAVAGRSGKSVRFLVPDLGTSGLMKLFS